MSLRNVICFSANVQMPNNTLASTKIYMLELSPASTKCTHGAAIKLFCRCRCLGGREVLLYSPPHSRPWIG
jgi:hypothetical protein